MAKLFQTPINVVRSASIGATDSTNGGKIELGYGGNYAPWAASTSKWAAEVYLTDRYRLVRYDSSGAALTPMEVYEGGAMRFNYGTMLGSAGEPLYQTRVFYASASVGTWRRLATVTLANQQYSTSSYKITITDPNANHGSQGSVHADEYTYYVACVRTENTTLDTPNMCIVRGPGDHIRAVQVATGQYEIQIQNELANQSYLVSLQCYARNGNQFAAAYEDGSTAGSSGIATYSASVGQATEWMQRLTTTGDSRLRSNVYVETASFRWKQGSGTTGYGVIARNDGTNFYFLQTALDDADGSWTTARPLGWALSTGNVTVAGFTGGTVAMCLASDATGYVDVRSTQGSTSTTNGALRVAGGLGVVENIRAGGTVYAGGFRATSSGSASVPAFGWSTDTGENTGMYRIGENNVGFSAGATQIANYNQTQWFNQVQSYIDVVGSDSSGQLNLRPTSGALNRESELRMWATFSNSVDTGQRFATSIRSGFSANVWGNEYLDIWVNDGTPNDSALDSKQVQSARFTAAGMSVPGTLTVGGNLVVNGTTYTVNSTTVTLDDPIITLGGDTAPVVDDNKDRGVEFRWHNGTVAKVGFFGFDDSSGKFVFIPDATNTSEVMSGASGVFYGIFEGDGSALTALNMANVGSGILGIANGGSGTNTATGTGNLVLATSPALTGTPTTPTAAVDTNTTQIASTAYVVGQGYLKAATAASTYQPLNAQLTALAALATTGLIARTGTNTVAARTLTGTANELTVTNGNGVSGNPTISLPAALTFTGKTVTGGTFNSGAFNGTLGATSPSTVTATTVSVTGPTSGTLLQTTMAGSAQAISGGGTSSTSTPYVFGGTHTPSTDGFSGRFGVGIAPSANLNNYYGLDIRQSWQSVVDIASASQVFIRADSSAAQTGAISTFRGIRIDSPSWNASASIPTTWEQIRIANNALSIDSNRLLSLGNSVSVGNVFTNVGISNVAVTSNVVTVTTPVAHNYIVNQVVRVAAVTNTAINGTATITSVTSTTFTYSKTTADIASVADTGTVYAQRKTNLWIDGTGDNYINGRLLLGSTNLLAGIESYKVQVTGSIAATGVCSFGFGSYSTTAPRVTTGDTQYGMSASSGSLYLHGTTGGHVYFVESGGAAQQLATMQEVLDSITTELASYSPVVELEVVNVSYSGATTPVPASGTAPTIASDSDTSQPVYWSGSGWRALALVPPRHLNQRWSFTDCFGTDTACLAPFVVHTALAGGSATDRRDSSPAFGACGLINLVSSGSANSGYCIQTNSIFEATTPEHSTAFVCRGELLTGSTYRVKIGFMDNSLATTDPNYGAWFRFDGTVWSWACRNNGTIETGNISLANVYANLDLGIWLLEDEALFRIRDSVTGELLFELTQTTGVPNNSAFYLSAGVIAYRTSGVAANLYVIDYLGVGPAFPDFMEELTSR